MAQPLLPLPRNLLPVMAPPAWLAAALGVAVLMAAMAEGAIVERTFNVSNLEVSRLCQNRIITAVNGQFPGPTLIVHEGDTVVVHVLNQSPHNISIHWHGIFQRGTPWADGPSYVTQCPIRPGNRYTYRFTVVGQMGTLWWHAHFSMLRGTVYGALIIKPAMGIPYPFAEPYEEVPILLGEWWNADLIDIANQALAAGAPPNKSDAYTINGLPGNLYPCSTAAFTLNVMRGKTYLLRIINAAVNNQLFFKVAGHTFTVVAADASYTTPFPTDVIVTAPGQTVNALMTANAAPGNYYMAASAFISASIIVPFDNTTTTGIVSYATAPPPSSSNPPVMPVMPNFTDVPTANRFYTGLTSPMGMRRVPLVIDEHMFITFGFGAVPCASNQPQCNPATGAAVASMNNISFVFPTDISLLEAKFRGVSGVYTTDFPDNPPVFFNFTDLRQSFNPALLTPERATRAKTLKYNAAVQMVLQDTAIIATESHPIHMHGFDFAVIAQGFGNFNASTDTARYNLKNPQFRNTIAVPTGGWAVIRLIANNPGIWLMHCHLDAHLPIGLATIFEVENGPTPATQVPPPPADLPKC